MDAETQKNLRSRTDAKLVYAELHLAVLQERGSNSGSDFDRAFEESILFHLLGAKESFVVELNEYYNEQLAADNISPGKLQAALAKRGVTSRELAHLHDLASDPNSWLSHAKQMRDHCAHTGGVPRAFHLGGPNHGQVFFRNPKTGTHVEVHTTQALARWIVEMRQLLDMLRASSIAANAA